MFISGLHKCVQVSVLVLHIIYQQVVIQNMQLKYENQFSNSYHLIQIKNELLIIKLYERAFHAITP